MSITSEKDAQLKHSVVELSQSASLKSNPKPWMAFVPLDASFQSEVSTRSIMWKIAPLVVGLVPRNALFEGSKVCLLSTTKLWAFNQNTCASTKKSKWPMNNNNKYELNMPTVLEAPYLKWNDISILRCHDKWERSCYPVFICGQMFSGINILLW